MRAAARTTWMASARSPAVAVEKIAFHQGGPPSSELATHGRTSLEFMGGQPGKVIGRAHLFECSDERGRIAAASIDELGAPTGRGVPGDDQLVGLGRTRSVRVVTPEQGQRQLGRAPIEVGAVNDRKRLAVGGGAEHSGADCGVESGRGDPAAVQAQNASVPQRAIRVILRLLLMLALRSSGPGRRGSTELPSSGGAAPYGSRWQPLFAPHLRLSAGRHGVPGGIGLGRQAIFNDEKRLECGRVARGRRAGKLR
jgi:hypothetical protein